MQATSSLVQFTQGATLKEAIEFNRPVPKPGVDASKVLSRYVIPDEDTMNKAIEKTREMQRKHPNMKPERVARKIAEFFHLPAKVL